MKQIKLKLLFIIIVFTGITNTVFSQSNNYILYYNNIERAYNSGIFRSNNDSTIYYIKEAIKEAEPYPEDLYTLSKALNKKGLEEEAFKFLVMSIKEGIDSTMLIGIDEKFNLNESQIQKCKLEYSNYSFNVDTILYYELDSVTRLDQVARKKLHKNKNEELISDIITEMHKQDSLNREWLLYRINTKGWPGRKIIGNDRKSFTLLLHIQKSWIDKNINILMEQIEKGNLNPSFLASSLDKYYFFISKESIIYNSFMPGNMRFDDTKEMKKKRKEIGALSSIVINERGKIRKKEWKPKNSEE